MKRSLVAAALSAGLVPATAAFGQGAPPPPGQTSIISVRVGSTIGLVPCYLAYQRTLIAPGRPWQPGDPVEPPVDLAPTGPGGCRGLKPIVLRRARHMTITLLGQSPQVAATWFTRGRPTPLAVRPVGEPPSAVWFLQLPVTSGKLVIHMHYPVGVSAQGAVSQTRADYGLAIRRRPPSTEPAPAEPVIPVDSTPPTAAR